MAATIPSPAVSATTAIQGGLGTGDIAAYDNARANYTIDVTTVNNIVTAFNGVTESTVVGDNEGHDTLTGIEILQFSGTTLNLNQAVQLFNNAGKLIGTFDHIQDAVNGRQQFGPNDPRQERHLYRAGDGRRRQGRPLDHRRKQSRRAPSRRRPCSASPARRTTSVAMWFGPM